MSVDNQNCLGAMMYRNEISEFMIDCGYIEGCNVRVLSTNVFINFELDLCEVEVLQIFYFMLL